METVSVTASIAPFSSSAASSGSSGSRRRVSYGLDIGDVKIGADAPVVVQSMTNTDTSDVIRTVNQICSLVKAGSEIVRVTVNTPEAAHAVPRIVETLRNQDVFVPIVGDFHFNGHELLARETECARALAKYRINPGNVGFGKKKDRRFTDIVEIACRLNKPIRIGVNWGSLDSALLAAMMDENAQLLKPRSDREVLRSALVTSALRSAERAEDIGLPSHHIVLSAKVSDSRELTEVYRLLGEGNRYALHVGLTEAGMGVRGVVGSACALALVLAEGIGDTIRVSLTPRVNGDRCEEVLVARQILESLQLRAFSPQIVACPGCGRTTSTVFQDLAETIDVELKARMDDWRRRFPGVEAIRIAVMGCIVNGPGESRHADIGISLPGTGESPAAPVYEDGVKVATLRGANLSDQFLTRVEQYVIRRFGS